MGFCGGFEGRGSPGLPRRGASGVEGAAVLRPEGFCAGREVVAGLGILAARKFSGLPGLCLEGLVALRRLVG